MEKWGIKMAIKVQLLAHTPDPEQVVAMAAKLCYSPSDISEIREGLSSGKALAAYERVLSEQARAYKEIRDALAAGYINEYLKAEQEGDDEAIIEAFRQRDKARCAAFIKKANEDARFILPNASTTKIVCTFNARSLQNFFAHRCCNRAQWEIREVAEQMLLQCLAVAPHLFQNCGPSCLFGPCPEGSMSCGRQKEMREKYRRQRESGEEHETV